MSSTPETRAPSDLPRAPALERLLASLRRRLVALVCLHGFGTAATAAVIWLAFTFALDWFLHVPAFVRAVHLAVLVALPLALLWRELWRPLARVPGPSGMAVLVERKNPDLHEVLVSAAQLRERAQRGEAIDGAPELAQLVVAEAERRAGELRPAGVLDARGPRWRALGGFAAVGLALLFALSQRELSSIFVSRLLGGSTAWPQRTHLVVEIPAVGETRVEAGPELVLVRVARGADVSVVVRANGVVPDEVTLRIDGGEDVVLAPSGGGIFRTVLRSCQTDLSFRAYGGDDDDGMPRVEIEVLQPPDVAGVSLAVVPPAYTGRPETRIEGGDAQVLAGSTVRVRVLAWPSTATGVVRLLPEDRTIELAPTGAPTAPADLADGDASDAVELGFELVAERSLRYRFELVDPSGLSNPDPGLYALTVVEDRAPTLAVVSPVRTDVETIAGGSLALQVIGEDDFGLAELAWSAITVGAAASPKAAEGAEGGDAARPAGPGGALARIPLADTEGGALASPATGEDAALAPSRRAMGRARVTVAELAGGDASQVEEGRQFQVELFATDTKAPEPNVGRAAPIRVRIVSADALLRRVQDRLSRARQEATALAELQSEKRARVEELLDGLKSDSPLEGGDAQALAAALTGQRRVLGDARSLSRELAAVTTGVLYSGLDEKASALLEELDRRMSRVTDRQFHPEIWRALAEDHRAGRLGSPGLAGRLVQILDQALAISEVHAELATVELDRARSEVGAAGVAAALASASDAQARSLAEIESLLERLSEWDNFQSVLLLTRDILNRQKALKDRTRQLATEK